MTDSSAVEAAVQRVADLAREYLVEAEEVYGPEFELGAVGLVLSLRHPLASALASSRHAVALARRRRSVVGSYGRRGSIGRLLVGTWSPDIRRSPLDSI